jgi:hypothetical protein
MQAPLSNNGQLPKDLKVLHVCEMLRALPVKLTPKQFMLHYLTSLNSDLAFLRRFRTQPTGVDSTIELLEALSSLLKSNASGKEAWNRFVKKRYFPLFYCWYCQ